MNRAAVQAEAGVRDSDIVFEFAPPRRGIEARTFAFFADG